MKRLNISKNFLYNEYIINKKSIRQIDKMVGCSNMGIRYNLIKYNVPIRTVEEGQYLRSKSRILTKRFLIKEYIKNEKPTTEIAQMVKCCSLTICNYLNKYKIKIRPSSYYMIGKQGRNFKIGKYKTVQGYVLIYKPKRLTSNIRGYTPEHRYAMEKYLERYLKPKEVVHHINGIKTDNRIENLLLFPNRKAHLNSKHFNKKTFICKFCRKNQRSV